MNARGVVLSAAEDGSWSQLLDADYLTREYPQWAPSGASRSETAEAFLKHGVPELAPLHEGMTFDVEYFRETRPAWEGADPAECYRGWLLEEQAAAPASPRAHLDALGLAIADYPTAFPWRFYARMRPCGGAHRWAALDDFMREGFEACGETIPYGDGAHAFLVAVARSYAGREDRLAIKAFELAATFAPLSSEERQHLADSHLREGDWRVARDLYQEVLSHRAGTVWTARNHVLAITRSRDWDGAVQALLRMRRSMAADPLWRQTSREVVAEAFQSDLRLARARYADGLPEEGDQIVASALDKAVARCRRLEPPRRTRAGPRRGVLLLANCDDPLGRAHRVDQKARLLDSLGIPVTVIPMNEVEAFEAALPDAFAAIFFRVPALPDTLRAVTAARAQGVATLYDVDALVFDAAFVPPLENFRGLLASRSHEDLRLSVPLYRAFASFCDAGLAPTASIAQRLARIVRTRKAFVLGDGVTAPADLGVPAGHGGRPPSLFLRSSRFLYLDPAAGGLGAAVWDVMSRRQDVRLATSGHVKLASAFNALDERVAELGASPDPRSYLATLAASRVNLAPQPIPGDDGAAVLSWVEAASVSVPSVVDAGAGLSSELSDGDNVAVAKEPEGWTETVERLLVDGRSATRMGEQARQTVLSTRAPDVLAAALHEALMTTAGRASL